MAAMMTLLAHTVTSVSSREGALCRHLDLVPDLFYVLLLVHAAQHVMCAAGRLRAYP